MDCARRWGFPSEKAISDYADSTRAAFLWGRTYVAKEEAPSFPCRPGDDVPLVCVRRGRRIQTWSPFFGRDQPRLRGEQDIQRIDGQSWGVKPRRWELRGFQSDSDHRFGRLRRCDCLCRADRRFHVGYVQVQANERFLADRLGCPLPDRLRHTGRRKKERRRCSNGILPRSQGR